MLLPQKYTERLFSHTFVKFCMIGVINGIVGFSIILALMYIFNVNYLISNIIGYGVGLSTSFTLNKYVNFKSVGAFKIEFPVFIISFFIAYSINILLLYTIVDILQESKLMGLIVGSSVYTALFYLSSRYLVFHKKN
jgi:putative flippase GtrA